MSVARHPSAASPAWPADLTDRVSALFANLELLSPAAFSVGGTAFDVARVGAMPAPAGAPPGPPAHQGLRAALASVIYSVAYARAYRGGPASPEVFARPLSPDADFAAELARANPTAGGWEAGWQVFQLGLAGALHVRKGEAAIQTPAGQYAFTAGGGARPPTVGDPVEVLVRRDSLTLQPGVYFAFGDTVANDYDFGRIARLYFHVPAAEAPWLLATLGTVLNRHFIAWRFKCPLDRGHFDRADGAVLYVARRFLPATLRLLAPFRGDLEARLSGEAALFARPLLPGLSTADDPGSGESFGQSRSFLLADAALDAWRAGRTDVDSRMDALVAAFARSGLQSQAPHLAAGLADIHAWPTPAASNAGGPG